MLTPRKADIDLSSLSTQPAQPIRVHLQKTYLLRACAVIALGYSLSGPLHAATSGNFSYYDTGTSITITGYPATEIGEVIIPATIDEKPVTRIGDWAFNGCNKITQVTIPTSVTSIGYNAFYNCSGLDNVTIPGSVTTIDTFAFRGCSKLTSFNIPSKVTSIGDLVFTECTNLALITVDPDNTEYSSNAGVLFNKVQTELIAHPPGKTGAYEIPPGVTDIRYYAFVWQNNLTRITIPPSVKTIGDHAFYNCTSLEELNIPPSVINIGDYAFYNCNKLQTLTLDPEKDLVIGPYAFSYCTGLVRVDFKYDAPFSFYQLSNFSFSYCNELKSINLYFTSTSAYYNLVSYAFAFCPALRGVYIQGDNSGNRLYASTIFEGDDLLTVYYVEGTSGWPSMLAGHATSPISSKLNNFHLTHGLSPDGTEDFLIPAADGIPNLHKYAFNMIGSSPGQATALDIPNTQRVTNSSSAGLPLSESQENGETRLKWTYIRRKASTSPGITYLVEFADDLASPAWAANPSATESVTSIDANFERVTLIDSTANAPRRFTRVRVTSP